MELMLGKIWTSSSSILGTGGLTQEYSLKGPNHIIITLRAITIYFGIKTCLVDKTHLLYFNCCFFRWDFIRDGSSLMRDMDRLDAFNKGLTTWGQWVDQNVNVSQTRVFFQGISPTHYM